MVLTLPLDGERRPTPATPEATRPRPIRNRFIDLAEVLPRITRHASPVIDLLETRTPSKPALMPPKMIRITLARDLMPGLSRPGGNLRDAIHAPAQVQQQVKVRSSPLLWLQLPPTAALAPPPLPSLPERPQMLLCNPRLRSTERIRQRAERPTRRQTQTLIHTVDILQECQPRFPAETMTLAPRWRRPLHRPPRYVHPRHVPAHRNFHVRILNDPDPERRKLPINDRPRMSR